MSSDKYPLRQSGIYHNLPTFDPSLKNLSAILLGATGLSGFHALRALLEDPQRWSKIYAVSRKPLAAEMKALLTEDQVWRIEHLPLDLQNSKPRAIADQLKAAGVSAQYIFYYAYLQPDSARNGMDPSAAQALIDANVPMFDNLLTALPLAGITPKRILLQTGGKNYGVHIGRARTPFVESDPQPRHLQPSNFYYYQEDLLKKFCAEHPETTWNVIRPVAIVGAAPNSPLSFFYPFAVYAAVQARKGEPLRFGGDFARWQFQAAHSTARMTGYLSEWAVLEDKCANQAFNAQDGGALSWDRFSHELGRWFGTAGVEGPVEDEKAYQTITFTGGKSCPLGYGPPTELRRSFTLLDWARDPVNRQTWETIMAESGGKVAHNPWLGDVDNLFLCDWIYFENGTISMNKVRLFGFNGFVDTLESLFETFKEFEAVGMLPKLSADKAQPLV